jgi:hypothetical protein
MYGKYNVYPLKILKLIFIACLRRNNKIRSTGGSQKINRRTHAKR